MGTNVKAINFIVLLSGREGVVPQSKKDSRWDDNKYATSRTLCGVKVERTFNEYRNLFKASRTLENLKDSVTEYGM